MNHIAHRAVITKIEAQQITVRLTPQTACTDCPAYNFCGSKDCHDRLITVETPDAASYNIGEKVNIAMSAAYGFKAVFYGYLLPLLLMLGSLITTYLLTGNETSAGIYSIIILIPYYFVLFWLKKYFVRKFHFRISRR